jgi:hypothetical protein
VINQRSEDDNILTLKSTDVSHGGLYNESDTFFAIHKYTASVGGSNIRAYRTDTGTPVYNVQAIGMSTSDTSKNTSGQGHISFYAFDQSGLGVLQNLQADTNVLSVRGRVGNAVRTLFLIDEDGDYYYDGTDGGAFDEFEDALLVRAFDVVRGNVIQSEFDRHAHYNEQTLVELGILGDTLENGGLVNGAQLQRLHNGAIWQNYTMIKQLTERVERYERALLDAGIDPALLEA